MALPGGASVAASTGWPSRARPRGHRVVDRVGHRPVTPLTVRDDCAGGHVVDDHLRVEVRRGAARPPSGPGRGRRCWSATSKTSLRLCEMIITAVPWLDEPFDQLEHHRRLRHAEGRGRLVHDHELGASDMHRLGHGDRLALTAGQRCRRAGGWSGSSSRGGRPGSRAPPAPCWSRRAAPWRSFSWPRNMFWTMSRLSHSARSW